MTGSLPPSGDSLQRVDAADYAAHVAALKHVFLTGDLRRPTPYPFVRDERLEIILCVYDVGDDGAFHWHRTVTEYELVVEGEVGYLDVASGRTHWFGAGDFSVIPPGACVKRLARRPARTVAVKVPSADEKVHCRQCERECTYRSEDYAGAGA